MEKTPVELAFENIYENNIWGEPSNSRRNKKFHSGGGANITNDFELGYRKLLQSYFDKPDVKTVIEIGCGDFEVTGSLDLSNVDYTGYDVVKSLIDYNNENFGSTNIRFVHSSNILQNLDLKADLIIIKDVLQHLPMNFYLDFIKNIPNNFKYNLITNDYSDSNSDIQFGGYTTNNFSAEPFNMKTDILIHWKQQSIEAGHKITCTIR